MTSSGRLQPRVLVEMRTIMPLFRITGISSLLRDIPFGKLCGEATEVIVTAPCFGMIGANRMSAQTSK